MFVTFGRSHAASSPEARNYAYETLSRQPLFVDPDGMSGICDWFVIGGRGSGALSHVRSDRARRGTDRMQPALLVTNQLERDPLRTLGYPDDADVLDQELYDTLLARHEGQSEEFVEGTLIYKDLESDPVSPAFIDAKWLVVVDCHL